MEGSEDVVRKTREQVDDEPSFEVVHSDDARVGHDLARRADERHVEVEEDVNEEDHVDKTVHHQNRNIVHRLALTHKHAPIHCCVPEKRKFHEPLRCLLQNLLKFTATVSRLLNASSSA